MKNARYYWLEDLVKRNHFTLGAEVGCKDGVTTSYLLKTCSELHLFAVDLWEFRPEILSDSAFEILKNYNFEKIKNDFIKSITPFRDRVTMLQGISWEAAKWVDDNSLDFVFIDADHAYESVVRDIRAWTPKLKPQGILSGHDLLYIGVWRAVNDLLNDWKDTGVNQVWCCFKENLYNYNK